MFGMFLRHIVCPNSKVLQGSADLEFVIRQWVPEFQTRSANAERFRWQH